MPSCKANLGECRQRTPSYSSTCTRLSHKMMRWCVSQKQLTASRAAAAEKQAAEQQLASTQLVLGGIERSRETIQRDSASASRAMHALRVELEQAEKDRGVLQQQLERAAVEQLEAVAVDPQQGSAVTPTDAAGDKRIAALLLALKASSVEGR